MFGVSQLSQRGLLPSFLSLDTGMCFRQCFKHWNSRGQIGDDWFCLQLIIRDPGYSIGRTMRQSSKKLLMGLTINTTRQHPLSDPLRGKDIVRVRV
ncbi:hypothetical protein WN51_04696 [Melipona quadrifasciata]|uniref:Uncharacterized protein n=1 Tax=Melipona quadrifasciata TaxID=166423 RepID=A0A0N0BKN0_9HYME|nr:hypothetical protein WN51_04696 [Melipona quadrifasciata]